MSLSVASGGIGLALTTQLMVRSPSSDNQGISYHVLLCARSPEKGAAALSQLKSRGLSGSVELLHLDVCDDATIYAAADYVSRTHGRLDVLVNNAAVGGRYTNEPHHLRAELREAFDTNATGPAVIVAAFEHLLAKAQKPRIVNIASGAGSIGRRLDPTTPHYKASVVPYRASKAALNMITACQHVEYSPRGWKVFLYNPGFTVSAATPDNTLEKGAKPAEEAVLPVVDIIEGRRDGDEGKLLHATGSYPW